MFRLCTAANLPEAHLLLHRLGQAGNEARGPHQAGAGGEGACSNSSTIRRARSSSAASMIQISG